jgi:hypothetical protein
MNEKIHVDAIRGYLKERKPLHCRRTLHQFYYPMLKSTEDRDSNQVAIRWAKRHRDDVEEKFYPIVMVDQLWLWILHDGCHALPPIMA